MKTEKEINEEIVATQNRLKNYRYNGRRLDEERLVVLEWVLEE